MPPASASSSSTRSGVAELLEEGTAPPGDIPPEIFAAALATFAECRRLDMRGLAAQLGIGRATLYRRVSGRDHLLGAVVWFLTRRALARSIEAADGLTGGPRVLATFRHLMRDVHGRPDLRRFLEAEPEAALRILTSKHGPVQGGIITSLQRLIEEETAHGAMRPPLDAPTLAYLIVRIGESFLYSDVIADNPPDVDRAIEVVERLLSA